MYFDNASLIRTCNVCLLFVEEMEYSIFKESDNSKIPKGVYSVYIGNKFDLNIRIYTIHYFFKFTMYHHHQYT